MCLTGPWAYNGGSRAFSSSWSAFYLSLCYLGKIDVRNHHGWYPFLCHIIWGCLSRDGSKKRKWKWNIALLHLLWSRVLPWHLPNSAAVWVLSVNIRLEPYGRSPRGAQINFLINLFYPPCAGLLDVLAALLFTWISISPFRACDVLQLTSSNALCCDLSVLGYQQKTERCSGNVVGILSSSFTLCFCFPLPSFLVDGTFLLSNSLS